MKPIRRINRKEIMVTVDGFDIPTLIGALSRVKDAIQDSEYTLYTDRGNIVVSKLIPESDESYFARISEWQKKENEKIDKMEKEVLKQKKQRKLLYEELKKEFESKE